MHHRLAKRDAEKPRDTLPDLRAKAFAEREIEVKGGNKGRITSRNAGLTLGEIKAETVGKTLSSIESEALIHSFNDTLLKWWWPRYFRTPYVVWIARHPSKQKMKAIKH